MGETLFSPILKRGGLKVADEINSSYSVIMKNITKTFPGVVALANVNFELEEGEVKGLVGENGAGKSTLIKILTGAYTPDQGEIIIFGEKFGALNPIIAEKKGIAAVYQDLMLANHLTVQENIFLGNELSKLGLINKKEMTKRTNELLANLGYEGIIHPLDKVRNLSSAHKGMVAIAKALAKNAKIMIFDEPTAVLAEKEVKELFRVVKQLRNNGISVIYISHRLEEVFEICDTVTVLKDGKVVGSRKVEETTEDELITMMVGRELKKDLYLERNIGEEVLRVENLTNNKVKDCSFSIKKGEIVGIYGLVGSGRTELVRALFGADPIEEGNIYIRGKKVNKPSPNSSIKRKLGLLPEDRREQGLALRLSVKDNINLPIYTRISKIGIINSKKEKDNTFHFIESLSIKTPTIYQKVENLSGGNQQKVVLSKWLASESEVFILDEPTNGIDVGAKEEIYELINDLASRGNAILFISSYIPELMSICDRILVMREGTISGEVTRDEFSEEKILSIALKTENNKVGVKND
ncbi:ABC transporter related [Petrotoga mobilis SJ95]|uniref:ABC transporter related n=2 Tax=Petrotoga TaxID=28236 RepID=A9BGQ5_PETMO|nr:ABC transporter related [Petrotoga mobilis SJ95]